MVRRAPNIFLIALKVPPIVAKSLNFSTPLSGCLKTHCISYMACRADAAPSRVSATCINLFCYFWLTPSLKCLCKSTYRSSRCFHFASRPLIPAWHYISYPSKKFGNRITPSCCSQVGNKIIQVCTCFCGPSLCFRRARAEFDKEL
jgi:hypothetical protein